MSKLRRSRSNSIITTQRSDPSKRKENGSNVMVWRDSEAVETEMNSIKTGSRTNLFRDVGNLKSQTTSMMNLRASTSLLNVNEGVRGSSNDLMTASSKVLPEIAQMDENDEESAEDLTEDAESTVSESYISEESTPKNAMVGSTDPSSIPEHGVIRKRRSILDVLSKKLDRSLVTSYPDVGDDNRKIDSFNRDGKAVARSSSSLSNFASLTNNAHRRRPARMNTNIDIIGSLHSLQQQAAGDARELTILRDKESTMVLMQKQDPRTSLQTFVGNDVNSQEPGTTALTEANPDVEIKKLLPLMEDDVAYQEMIGDKKKKRKKVKNIQPSAILEKMNERSRLAGEANDTAQYLALKKFYEEQEEEQAIMREIFKEMMTEVAWKSNAGKLSVSEALKKCSSRYRIRDTIKWGKAFDRISNGNSTITVDTFLKARATGTYSFPNNSIAKFMDRSQHMTKKDFYGYLFPEAPPEDLDWMVCFSAPKQMQQEYEDVFINSPLSNAQCKEIRTLYKHYDRENCGGVKMTELVKGFQRLGYSRDEAEAIFLKHSKGDEDAKLDMDTFTILMKEFYYYSI